MIIHEKDNAKVSITDESELGCEGPCPAAYWLSTHPGAARDLGSSAAQLRGYCSRLNGQRAAWDRADRVFGTPDACGSIDGILPAVQSYMTVDIPPEITF